MGGESRNTACVQNRFFIIGFRLGMGRILGEIEMAQKQIAALIIKIGFCQRLPMGGKQISECLFRLVGVQSGF